MVYVVVIETGVYDDFDYTIDSVYERKEDAETAVELLEYENRLERQIAAIREGRVVATSFEIYELLLMPSAPLITKEDIDKEYAVKIEEAKEFRRTRDLEQEKQKQDSLTSMRQKIADYIHWYATSRQFADKEKERTKYDIIAPVIQQYLAHCPEDTSVSEFWSRIKS